MMYGKMSMTMVTDKIQERRKRFAGHNVRHAGTLLSKLIFWEPTHGRASRGRPPLRLRCVETDTVYGARGVNCMHEREI